MPVSLHLLVANPERYDGQLVETTGVFLFQFEGDALYLDSESYAQSLTLNSVLLRLDLEKLQLDRAKERELSGNFAKIEGTFVGEFPTTRCAGYPREKREQDLDCIWLGLDYAGMLKDITLVEVRPKIRVR